jgi:hypothetical protein
MGLSVGTDPLGAKVVGNNLLPLREPMPVVGEHRTIALPSVAIDVPAGQSLYLTVSALSDLSIGHGSRVPGVVTLDDVVVNLPVVEPPAAVPEAPSTTTTTTPTPTVAAPVDAAAAPVTTGRRSTTTTTVGAPATTAVTVPVEDAAPTPTPPGGDVSDDDGVPLGLALLAGAVLAAAAGLGARIALHRR